MIARAGLLVRSRRGFGLPSLGALLFLERSAVFRCDGLAHRIVWVCGRAPDGPRVELVSRQVKPGLEQYWASGATARA